MTTRVGSVILLRDGESLVRAQVLEVERRPDGTVAVVVKPLS